MAAKDFSSTGLYRCTVCGRAVSTLKVTVDGEKASKVYSKVSAQIRIKGAKLSGTAAHRIGGKNFERFRVVLTDNALAYCQIASSLVDDFDCMITEAAPEQAPVLRRMPDGLSIKSPEDDAMVGSYTPVRGVIGGESGAHEGNTVWVLIKPDGDYFWVQRPARVSNNRWRSEARFGDPFTEDGHCFMVCAIIEPIAPLKTAQRLRDIPQGLMTSNVVMVTFRSEES